MDIYITLLTFFVLFSHLMCYLRCDVIHCHVAIAHVFLNVVSYVFLIFDCPIYVNRIVDELLEHVQRHVATNFFNSLVLRDIMYTHVIMDIENVNLVCLSKADIVME